MVLKTLCDYLDRERIRYTVISHSPAFSAQEIAAASHISGREIAKTVVLRVDGVLVLAVLPASCRIDLNQLADTLGSSRVELAAESEFSGWFPGCETGAMPPIGSLFGLPTYVADELAEDEYIAFNAGTHTELIQLRFADYERLVRPRVMPFCAARA